MITEVTFTVPGKIYLKVTAVSNQEQFGYEMSLISKLIQLEIDWQLMVYFLTHWRGELAY